MTDLQTIGKQAKQISAHLALLDTKTKNHYLHQMADALEAAMPEILTANEKDLVRAQQKQIRETMIDRLRLTNERISDMAQGIRQVAQLPDPIGETTKMWKNSDNLTIGQRRVPLGVVGMIYESRPTVTTDAASLCFKTGNAIILRGGSDALHSNQALVAVLQTCLRANGLAHAIQLVDDPSHALATEMMNLTEYLDVLIPRGGAGLIQHVKKNATVPIIETGTGNNHIYVDQDAQRNMATNIILNAKTQRPSVCNAIETVLIHAEVAPYFLPKLGATLIKQGVELRADERAQSYLDSVQLATEEDWQTEYLDYILAIKVVDSLDEAIEHINRYNTKHSEAIITDNYFHAEKFLNEVDAAAVYVNASTRFTDGFVFGFGAEIGISTQKLHARGPMGLAALTSTKYVIYGAGQIRE
ncbi:MAG: glutamate-5-semialdehyde dehydrogenase [Enterococcus sp.]